MNKTLSAILLASPLTLGCSSASESQPVLNQEEVLYGGNLPENKDDPYQPYIDLAKCLVSPEVDARVYSAVWCDPCKVQEEQLQEELGDDWPYFKEQVMVECYEPRKITKTQRCKEKGIAALPVWEFPSDQGTEWKYGGLSVDKIAEYSGCEY